MYLKVLINGCQPECEFTACLDCSIELYQRLKQRFSIVHIYVPGSLHNTNGIIDQCTLSTDGKRYLMERGILEHFILGDKENKQYKGDEGVLNSADEFFVTYKIFINGDFSELHFVCSPIQVALKWFYFMEFGLMPLIHSVPVTDSDVMDIVLKQLRGVENVIYNDYSAQSHDS